MFNLFRLHKIIIGRWYGPGGLQAICACNLSLNHNYPRYKTTLIYLILLKHGSNPVGCRPFMSVIQIYWIIMMYYAKS